MGRSCGLITSKFRFRKSICISNWSSVVLKTPRSKIDSFGVADPVVVDDEHAMTERDAAGDDIPAQQLECPERPYPPWTSHATSNHPLTVSGSFA